MTSSVDKIFSNIYGEEATGRIINKNRPLVRTKYLDEEPGGRKSMPRLVQNKTYKQPVYRPLRSMSMFGGAKDIETYASPEYAPDNGEMSTFFNRMFLYYRVSHSPTAAIYVIPTKAKLTAMIKIADKILAGTDPSSIDAQKMIVSKADDIGYKRYLFTVYGDNTTEHHYRIDDNMNGDKAYPEAKFEQLRRTNLASEVYNVEYVNAKTVKLIGAGNKSEILDYVARCDRGVYIFSGEIPEPISVACKVATISKTKGGKAKKSKRSVKHAFSRPMTGGSTGKHNNLLCRLFEEYSDETADDISEKYMKYVCNKSKNNIKYLQGDILYSAVNHMLNNAVGSKDSVESFEDIMKHSNDDIDLKDISVNHVPSKNKHIIKNCQQKILHEMEKLEDNGNVSRMYKAMYGKSGDDVIRSDIIVSLLRNNPEMSIDDAIEDSDKFINEESDILTKSNIVNSFSKYPATSLLGKEYLPLFSSNANQSMDAKKKAKKAKSESDDEKNDADDVIDDIEETTSSKSGKKNKPDIEKESEEKESNDGDISKDINADLLKSFF